MSKPITIPLTNLKRNWKFNWFLSNPKDKVGSSMWENLKESGNAIKENIGDTTEKIKNLINDNGGLVNTAKNYKTSMQDLKKIQILSDTTLTMYVSQLAKSIDLPEDEVDFEYVLIGNVDYPVPIKMKMNPITVTYYDDNLDTVYAYHKLWISTARTDESNTETPGMTMNVINPSLCKSGKYVVWENSLSMIEYALLLKWLNRGMSVLTSATEKVTAFFNLPDISEAGEVVDPFLKWHSTQTFPALFPQKITRSQATKDGEGLAEVTVTYVRIPTFVERPKAYSGPNNFGLSD